MTYERPLEQQRGRSSATTRREEYTMTRVSRTIFILCCGLRLTGTGLAALPQSAAVDLVRIETPSSQNPKSYETYKKIPKGEYVLWQASSFGYRPLKYKLTGDEKFVEIMLIMRNDGKDAFTISQDKIILKRNGQEIKWWEAICPGTPTYRFREKPSFDKETSSYTVGHVWSKGGECTLKPGEQTYLMMLFMVPFDWNEGILAVTPDHQLKIKLPSQREEEKLKRMLADLGEAPSTAISLSVKDGWTVMNGKSKLWSEVFVFDPESGVAEVAEGAELQVADCPVPLRITGLSYGLSGSFCAIYRNVVFDCTALPPEKRLIYIATVDVAEGFSFGVKINLAGWNSIWITNNHFVVPGTNPNQVKEGPCVKLSVKILRESTDKAESRAYPDIPVKIRRESGVENIVTTDRQGKTSLVLKNLYEKVVWLEVEFPTNGAVTKYPIPVTLRGMCENLVIYDVVIKYKKADAGDGN